MNLQKAIQELYRRAATSLPVDVESSLKKALKKEKKGSLAFHTLSNILENIKLAREHSLPICQDTGTPTFYVKVPSGMSHHRIRQVIVSATRKATEDVPLRPNAVSVIDEKNSGDNVGLGEQDSVVNQPVIHMEQWDKRGIRIDLMLKGGGSENIGRQYKLPDKNLKADRDFAGVRKCIIDSVFEAQGKGCPPYILGVAIGGSKDLLARESKRQLLRKLDDVNEDAKLASLELSLREELNSLGIGAAGFGGKTSVLGVKIKPLFRHPASFFVDISFMCWACRRKSLTYQEGDVRWS